MEIDARILNPPVECQQAARDAEKGQAHGLWPQSMPCHQRGVFLRMPAEIRNFIYHWTLGSLNVHVYAENKASNAVASSRRGVDPKSRTKVRLYLCRVCLRDGKREWLDQHLNCYTSACKGFPNLGILFTCRQIYEEASLIPFTANTFIFVSPASFESFATAALLPHQAQALRSITLWSPITASRFTDAKISWSSWSIPQIVRERELLVGLQHLTVHLSIYRDDSAHVLDSTRGILSLGHCHIKRLKTVTISTTYDGVDEAHGASETLQKAIEQYTMRLKHVLLGSLSVPGFDDDVSRHSLNENVHVFNTS
ncbi:uncharacterized protein PV09_08744 [Verruconis gallopava]|uniref:DUF7730 domain-containing protein n=1 Tax=Verruconis gallopava TaxID=253628 RepID=A0A0D1YFQ3_9PEZI|nr:uncharacterized protein PV09_08744 [Verruconis gallopava]KIV99566.1 hypothetical protein PV09_08744 [Verruconis gallopava]